MECERATVLLSGMIDSALGPIARLPRAPPRHRLQRVRGQA